MLKEEIQEKGKSVIERESKVEIFQKEVKKLMAEK